MRIVCAPKLSRANLPPQRRVHLLLLKYMKCLIQYKVCFINKGHCDSLDSSVVLLLVARVIVEWQIGETSACFYFN